MGRKGIGKLAAFSIADTIEVHTADGITASGFRMNTDAIEACAADPERPDYMYAWICVEEAGQAMADSPGVAWCPEQALRLDIRRGQR